MAKSFGDLAARALGTACGRSDSRDRMVKAVRAACRRLGIDDDDRRAIQREITGKQSMSDMEIADLGRLLDHFNKGWSGPMGHRNHIAKIRALWWSLFWLGGIDDPKDPALNAFVKRQTGISAVRFLDHKKAASVIEALKSWAGREGVAWPSAAHLAEMATIHASLEIDMPRLERHAVLSAIADRMRDQESLRGGYQAYCRAALGLGTNHLAWTPHELDAAIRMLGRQARRAAGRRDQANV